MRYKGVRGVKGSRVDASESPLLIHCEILTPLEVTTIVAVGASLQFTHSLYNYYIEIVEFFFFFFFYALKIILSYQSRVVTTGSFFRRHSKILKANFNHRAEEFLEIRPIKVRKHCYNADRL